MKSFRDFPIKSKMTVAVLGTTLVALLAACVAFFAYERVTFSEAMSRNLSVLAEALASNSTAALSFTDADDAADTLKALRAEPSVEAAGLYNVEGAVFATYSRDKVPQVVPPQPEADGTRFEADRLVVVRPVMLKDDRLGTLYLRADLAVLTARLRSYAQISAIVLFGSLLLAFVLSSALQQAITRPIFALTGTVQNIAGTRDYTARAKKLGADEIGTLTDGFNQMLAGIQERDSALQTANEALRAENAERKRAEEELRTSHERFQIVARATNDAVWDWNLETDAMWWNEGYQNLFGYAPEETDPGIDSWIKFIHPEDVDRVTRNIHKVIDEGGEAWWDEYRFLRSDGEYADIFDRGHVTRDADGKPLRMIGAMQDITERREAEEKIRQLNASLEQRVRERTGQLEAAVKELDAFSYSVSHDLRAPLRAVDGFSRMVAEEYAERLDDDGRRMLGVIRSETQRMGRLIDDLLAFSRLGRQPIEPAPIDMRAMAQEVFDEMTAAEPARRLRLDLQAIPPACGAEAMIRQVWVNLIGNAVKFTKEREVGAIEIGVREDGDAGLCYFVKDNGAGFDTRFSDKLFGVFQRLHSQQEFQGTGVGLALVQRIVQRHGGRIWADSEVGVGATFFFTVPNQKS